MRVMVVVNAPSPLEPTAEGMLELGFAGDGAGWLFEPDVAGPELTALPTGRTLEVLDSGAAELFSPTSEIVVATGIEEVSTMVDEAGQLVTVGAQLMMVISCVEYSVMVV